MPTPTDILNAWESGSLVPLIDAATEDADLYLTTKPGHRPEVDVSDIVLPLAAALYAAIDYAAARYDTTHADIIEGIKTVLPAPRPSLRLVTADTVQA